jgi:Pyruvate/2-oxoacid:ferredoxin oxidoreductase delta subunit
MYLAEEKGDQYAAFRALSPVRHSHQCQGCGHIWSHAPAEAVLAATESIDVHDCPRCGREPANPDDHQLDRYKPERLRT